MQVPVIELPVSKVRVQVGGPVLGGPAPFVLHFGDWDKVQNLVWADKEVLRCALGVAVLDSTVAIMRSGL